MASLMELGLESLHRYLETGQPAQQNLVPSSEEHMSCHMVKDCCEHEYPGDAVISREVSLTVSDDTLP